MSAELRLDIHPESKQCVIYLLLQLNVALLVISKEYLSANYNFLASSYSSTSFLLESIDMLKRILEPGAYNITIISVYGALQKLLAVLKNFVSKLTVQCIPEVRSVFHATDYIPLQYR